MMSGAIKRRLLSLERNGRIDRAATMKELQYEVFKAMRFNHEDDKLLDAIVAQGEPSTPEEQAFLDRFAAEYEAAFKTVSVANRDDLTARRNRQHYR
jgi:hypothetical protein